MTYDVDVSETHTIKLIDINGIFNKHIAYYCHREYCNRLILAQFMVRLSTFKFEVKDKTFSNMFII